MKNTNTQKAQEYRKVYIRYLIPIILASIIIGKVVGHMWIPFLGFSIATLMIGILHYKNRYIIATPWLHRIYGPVKFGRFYLFLYLVSSIFFLVMAVVSVINKYNLIII